MRRSWEGFGRGAAVVGFVLVAVLASLGGPADAAPTGPPAGTYGAPEWFPLRHDLDGSPIKVGCTYESFGSSGGYECGGHHDRWALDLMAAKGTPVYPAGAGFATVATGAGGTSGYGNAVLVDHGFGVRTLYAHLSAVLVPASGAWVDPTVEIGKVGSTGRSTNFHLHFEKQVVTDHGTLSVDPGPLKACWGGFTAVYPQAALRTTWKGIPWGVMTAVSDGTACAHPGFGTPDPDGGAATPPPAGTAPAASKASVGSLGDGLAWFVASLPIRS